MKEGPILHGKNDGCTAMAQSSKARVWKNTECQTVESLRGCTLLRCLISPSVETKRVSHISFTRRWKRRQLWGNHWLVKTVPVSGYEKSGKNREFLSEEFHSKPDISRRESLLYNGYQVIPRGKLAGVWRWSPTPSSAKVQERAELYIYAPSGPSWPAIEWTLPVTSPLPLHFTCSLIPTRKVPWRWTHYRNRPEVSQVVRIHGFQGSNLGQETRYPAWHLSWFSSALPS
jgi:hypothetical protein